MTNVDLEAWRNNSSEFQREKNMQSFGVSFETDVEMPEVLKILGKVTSTKILDAGCGDGEFVDRLSKLGADVIGIDGSETQLAKAREFYPNEKYALGDLTDRLPFQDNSFDSAVSRFVLMFIDDLQSLAKESSRVLKPDGKLVLTVTHPFYPYLQDMLGLKHRYSGISTYGEKTRGEMIIGGNTYPFHFRPIENYLTPFLSAGFTLDNFREIVPSNEFIDQNLQLERMRAKPVFLTLGFKNRKD
jgi:ubiquinone/menaquinone biosynthesis C-methylase UbiE